MGTTQKSAGLERVLFPDPERCSGCSVGELCVAAGSDPATLAQLDELLETHETIADGTTVIRRGDPFRGLVAVRDGFFKSLVTDRSGREQILGFHFPGELIGLDALRDKSHRADVVALGQAAYCRLDQESLLDLASCSLQLQRQLFQLFSARLADHNWRGTDLTAEERIAGFLLDVSDRLVARGLDGDDFELPMSRGDIGNYLGLATETVSRVVRRLKDQGFIDVRRKQVRLLDRHALLTLAEPVLDTR